MAYNVEDMARLESKAKEENFLRWMSKPETKFFISMIPPMEAHPDLLQTVLKSAFIEGFDSGSGTMVRFLMSSFDNLKKD